MTEVSEVSKWVDYYCAINFHLFPLVPGTKSPFPGTRGSSEATNNPYPLRNTSGVNLGMVPKLGGYTVFDVDPRNGGWETVWKLMEAHGDFTPPARVLTPTGGEHWYFRARPGAKYIGSPGPGVDIKHAGYVVLPPSRHPNGGHYRWITPPDQLTAVLLNAPLAPAWLERPERPPRPPRAESPANAGTGLVRLYEALQHRDPDGYDSWAMAIASARHFADSHDEATAAAAYDVVLEWSRRSGKHDDGAFEDKWNTFDSGRADARTLGSLLHEAGLTRAQTELTPADAFAAPPVLPPGVLRPEQVEAAPLPWRVGPVERYQSEDDDLTIVAYVIDAGRGINLRELLYRTGGDHERVYRLAQQYLGAVAGDPLKRAIVAEDAAMTSYYTAPALTPLQVATVAAVGEGEGGVTLDVSNGSVSKAVTTCLARLGTPGVFPDLFQRGGRLVRATEHGIVEHDKFSLGQLIEQTLQVSKGKGKPSEAPEALILRVLNAGAFPGVRELRGVVPAPVARPDGSILDVPGYDVASGLLLRKAGPRAARVLDVAGVQAALASVWAPFQLFPWQSDLDKAVFLSALFTAVTRPTLPTAPAFLIDAQGAATGKTLLGQCLMRVAGAGTDVRVMPSDEAEFEKRVLSWLSVGAGGLLIDNVKGSLRDDGALCAVLTSPQFTGRVLGRTESITVDCRALVAFTGNNVSLRGDLTRRIFRSSLKTPPEAERRAFDFNPLDLIDGEYRMHLLDLLATYAAHGCPRMAGYGLASYPEWDRLVRGAVQFYGFADPVEAMDAAREDDLGRQAERLFLLALKDRFGSRPFTTHELKTAPMDGPTAALWGEAMDALGGQAERLPYVMRRLKGLPLDGLQLVTKGLTQRTRVARWAIEADR